MNSRERVRLTLDHQEADHVPFDLGGGFVFAAVHDIQANVPSENIMAMWEAWKTYGVYTRS